MVHGKFKVWRTRAYLLGSKAMDIKVAPFKKSLRYFGQDFRWWTMVYGLTERCITSE
jgi:hypothetical protein